MRFLVLALFLAACKQPIPDTTDGKQLFEYTCARCHGNDGHGDPVLKPQLGVPDMTEAAWQARLTDDDIARTVHHGSRSGKMPALGNMYSDEQLAAIIKYVRHWRAP